MKPEPPVSKTLMLKLVWSIIPMLACYEEISLSKFDSQTTSQQKKLVMGPVFIHTAHIFTHVILPMAVKLKVNTALKTVIASSSAT